MLLARVIFANALLILAGGSLCASSSSRYYNAFHEVSGLVQNFSIHDKDSLRQWEAVIQKFEPILPKIADQHSFTVNMNLALEQIGLGRQALVHNLEQSYWLYAASPKKEGQRPYYFGAWFERRGKHWYVRDVFPGSPAHEIGLMRGDEILSLEGQEFNPILLTQHKAEQRSFKLSWRRDPMEAPQSKEVQAIPVNYSQDYAALIQSTARIELVEGKKIAYVRLPGMRTEWLASFQLSLQRVLKKADALVLDLRASFAGRDSGFLPLFFENSASAGKPPQSIVGKRDIYILLDRNTSEGLEWLAYLLKDRHGATLIGESSAGQAFETEEIALKSGPFLLRLVRPDPQKLDGLEYGKPLAVDIPLQAPLIYARGRDEVLEQGFKIAAADQTKKASKQ